MALTKIKTGKNKGRYRVRIQPVDSVTGKVISIPSKIAKNLQEAKKLERLMWGQYEKSGANIEEDAIFAEEFGLYCRKEYEAGRWSKSTYTDWNYSKRLVEEFFGKTKIKDIREETIRSFARNYIDTHNGQVSRHSTVERRLQHLRQYFDTLKEQGIIKVNPVPKGALRKFFRYDEFIVTDEKYIFSDKEVENIRKEITKELFDLPISFWVSRIGLLLILDTGMRPQEVQVVKWSQLINDGEFKVFEINDSWSEKNHTLNHHLKGRVKGFSRKTLPLSDETLKIIDLFHQKQVEFLKSNNQTNKNDYILLNLRDSRLTSEGMPIGQASMNLIIKKVAKKVKVNNQGKQISCYNCRHTVASKWANTSGITLSFLAFRLGHSVQQLLKTYVHEDSDKSQNMMELMKKNNNKLRCG